MKTVLDFIFILTRLSSCSLHHSPRHLNTHHSWHPARFSFPAANPATSSSPPPRPHPGWLLWLQPPQPSRSLRVALLPHQCLPSDFPAPSSLPQSPLPRPGRPAGMQVSIACTEQNLRSRSSEDRLCGPRPGPGGGNGGPVGGGHGNPPGGGPKSRAALVPRPPAPAGALRESTGRGTGMKYRYGMARQPTYSLPFRDP